MRIIAGKYRGRVLKEFRGQDIRPTADRVKESVFQILSSRLFGARVLDLFCGSGALGIESLSRGAGEVVFNDISKESIKLLAANLKLVGERAQTVNLPYESCLKTLSGRFSLIFCDPPYKTDCAAEILSLIASYRRLTAGGIVVYESEREETPPEGWERYDLRSYGRTKVAFFRMV